MRFVAIIGGVHDIVLTVLAVAVGALLRVVYSLQQRVTRLEALDESRERVRHDDERGRHDVRDE